MKKIFSLIAAAGVMFAFSACNESKDDHPVLTPLPGTEQADFLNIPEMTNASIVFTAQNADGYVHMTCSQPNYGFAAPVCYQVEVSFDQNFTTPIVEGAPASVILNTAFYDCSQINPINGELAAAVCDLCGVVDESAIPTPAHKMYLRLQANIQQVGGDIYPGTSYVSNVVSISEVRCDYLALSVPDLPSGIFLRGGMNDWGAVPEYEFLTTKVFDQYVIKEVTIPQGTEFKVADSSWGEINLGADGALDDSYFDPDNKKAYKLAAGAGNITMPINFNGSITLTKKGANYTITFEPFVAAE